MKNHYIWGSSDAESKRLDLPQKVGKKSSFKRQYEQKEKKREMEEEQKLEPTVPTGPTKPSMFQKIEKGEEDVYYDQITKQIIHNINSTNGQKKHRKTKSSMKPEEMNQ